MMSRDMPCRRLHVMEHIMPNVVHIEQSDEYGYRRRWLRSADLNAQLAYFDCLELCMEIVGKRPQ